MKRILVIEDDASVRAVIVEALQTRSWRVAQAGDGEEGLANALTDPPDMILCDIQMPILDGYGVLRGIRSKEALATVPFLFLTGHGDKPMMRRAMEMGADDFIVKPFTIGELLAAVEARFQKAAVFEETADKKLQALRDTLRFALPHELVTPLNTILGFAGLLIEDSAPKPGQVQEFAGLIKSAGERLRGLIEKFLVYAQVELCIADRTQREPFLARPASATRDVIATVALRVAEEEQRDTDLNLHLSEALNRISPSHLERLVRELVENACKFSDRGQIVKVHSRPVPNGMELHVADEGRGFTAEQIRQVNAHIQFDRRLAEQQGSGLGLAICRGLAELYSGHLEIQSTPGRTLITVFLPT